ncbi:MAG: hypothetical protein U9Q92_00650 [archaeon]|nr:hypothetical protein [archaeon]
MPESKNFCEEFKTYEIYTPQDICLDPHSETSVIDTMSRYSYSNGVEKFSEDWGEEATDFIVRITELGENIDLIYRGIDFSEENILNIKEYGNNRIDSVAEGVELKANEYIFGDRLDSKALSHSRTNPQVLLVYDGSKLDKVQDTHYQYKLKEGNTWKEALSCVAIIHSGQKRK